MEKTVPVRLEIIDQLMYQFPDRSMQWSPKHFLDLRVGWDARYCSEFRQPFSPFHFCLNCAGLYGASRGWGAISTQILKDQADYLTFVADRFTIQNGRASCIVNNFRYQNFFCELRPGFLGAFMNAFTAYGFLFLYRATFNEIYLSKALNLFNGMTFAEAKVPVSTTDKHGNFWFYEYVFQTDKISEICLQHFGLECDDNGWIRAPVYNGHIHSLFALLGLKELIQTSAYDSHIDLAVATIENVISHQISGDHFTYVHDFPLLADYSQIRPVHQINGLTRLFPNSTCFSSVLSKFKEIHESEDLARAAEKTIVPQIYEKSRQSFEIYHRKMLKLAGQ